MTPTGERSRDGTIGQLNVILAGDPYDSDALDVVPKLRDSVNDVAPGVRVLVAAAARSSTTSTGPTPATSS